MVAARIAQALAPWLFGVCLDRRGANAMWLSASLGMLAFAALLFLPGPIDARTRWPARQGSNLQPPA
jgi:hypothetical protein